MSMEDILKELVNSRQQGSSSNTAADPMANLVGSLLSGKSGVNLSDGVDAGDVANLLGGLMGAAQQSQQPQTNTQQSGGLGNMMGLLESVMGGGQTGSQSDPVMMLLQPFVTPLAKKAKISPEIAMIVVSFVAHKLLAHHPSSGRDSSSFNLDSMLQQMGSGNIDSTLLHNSGMVKEISAKTGLDEATAAQSLEAAFSMMGKQLQSNSSTSKPKPKLPPKGTRK